MREKTSEVRAVWEGKFLRVVRRGEWDFVRRTKASGVIGVVAVTERRELVMVEQYRSAVDARVLEIPAGLAGDTEGREGEGLEIAARRELEEETGYHAARWVRLFTGLSSAGMTDEAVTFFFADGLSRVGEGGGEAGTDEDIAVHLAPVDGLMAWLREREQRGVMLDAKVFAGVGAARAMGLV